MIPRIAVLFSLIAVPVCGQPRVYTNADLGRPLTWSVPPPSDEQLAALKTRQFVAPVAAGDGPRVFVLRSDPADGPFGPFDSSPVQPLSDQLFFTTRTRGVPFGGFGGFRGGYRPREERTFTTPGRQPDRRDPPPRQHTEPSTTGSGGQGQQGPQLKAPPALGFPAWRAPAPR